MGLMNFVHYRKDFSSGRNPFGDLIAIPIIIFEPPHSSPTAIVAVDREKYAE